MSLIIFNDGIILQNVLVFLVLFQLQSAPFSLEHPSQYFAESRKVRGGLDSRPAGMESGQENGGVEPEDESVAMNITADISAKDIEDFDSF